MKILIIEDENVFRCETLPALSVKPYYVASGRSESSFSVDEILSENSESIISIGKTVSENSESIISIEKTVSEESESIFSTVEPVSEYPDDNIRRINSRIVRTDTEFWFFHHSCF